MKVKVRAKAKPKKAIKIRKNAKVIDIPSPDVPDICFSSLDELDAYFRESGDWIIKNRKVSSNYITLSYESVESNPKYKLNYKFSK